MVIYANGKEINVASVISTTIKKNGKTYPALKFLFQGEILENDITALASGEIKIGETIYNGYETISESSVVIGKITTAETELAEAQEVIEIITGDSNITPETAAEQRVILEEAVQSLPDESALQVKSYYPTWEECVEKGSVEYNQPGFKFTYGEDLYSCVNANPTFQADWIPGAGTESLYTRIDETHAGTADDPIPYNGNMILEEGKYYSEVGVVYICTRDTVNPVYNPLSELVGLYVEKAAE